MTCIVVSPLSRIAEMAVKHKAREMVTLIAKEQSFHRPAVVAAERHLTLAMNDIAFKGTGDLIAPDDAHVLKLIDFAGMGSVRAAAHPLLDGDLALAGRRCHRRTQPLS